MSDPITSDEMLAYELQCLRLISIGVKPTKSFSDTVLGPHKGRSDLFKRMRETSGRVPLPVQERKPLLFPNSKNEIPEENSCLICLETVKVSAKDSGWIVACGNRHIFHRNCLDGWRKNKTKQGLTPTCPTCRANITNETQTFYRHIGGGLHAQISRLVHTKGTEHLLLYDGMPGLEYKVEKRYIDKRYAVVYSGSKNQETVESIKYKDGITFFFSGVGRDKYISEVQFPCSDLMPDGASKFYTRSSLPVDQLPQSMNGRQIHVSTKAGKISTSFDVNGSRSDLTIETSCGDTTKFGLEWKGDKTSRKYTIKYIEKNSKSEELAGRSFPRRMTRVGQVYTLQQGVKIHTDIKYREEFNHEVDQLILYLNMISSIEREVNQLSFGDKKYLFDEYDEGALEECSDFRYTLSKRLT